MSTSQHRNSETVDARAIPLTRRRLVAAVGVAAAVGAVIASSLAIGQGRAKDNVAFTGAPVTNQRQVVDRANIVQTVDALFAQFDAENWQATGALLDDEIDVDFSSLGGPCERLTREQLVDGWRTAFAGPKSSGHSTSNHQVRVDGDRAEVFAHGYAYNALDRRFGGDTWETWSTYRFTLRRADRSRWIITGEQYNSLRVDGNEGVRDAVARG